jgi:hypothetical protein
MMGNQPELTGCNGPEMEHVTEPEEASERPLSMAWISEELLAETREIWTEAYGRPVGDMEATEILMNVKRMATALLKAKKEMIKK